MKEVFILSDYTQFFKELTKQLGFYENRTISLPFFENESSWHDWTTQLFKDSIISKLVIPISIPTDNPINTEGLKIALHIRLNYELTLSQRLIPIILLSDFSIENILGKNSFDADNNPQNLIFTKGIYFSTFDSDDIKTTINRAKPCKPEEYKKDILNKLNILRKDTIGGHDIANAWGCFKLAQVVGVSDKIFKLDSVSKHLKQLYAKYLICSNESFKTERRIDLDPIKCAGKKILFIDDKSDEGWSDLMKNIFKGAGNNFVFIDSARYKNSETKFFHAFDGFITECRSHIGKEWDLIIIDLRLNPEKEDIDNEMISPTEFSGYKLIDDFLTENEGYQIIVSTASNKIWNINAALERGASSYYVKESPEFNYSISETNKHYENFKNDVQKCFNRSYLRDIFQKTKLLKDSKLTKKEEDEYSLKELKITIKHNLDIAFILSKENTTLEYALFNYLQILESFCKFFTSFDKNNSRAIVYKSLDDRIKRINEVVIYEVKEDKIYSNYKYKKGFYYFQKNKKEGKDEQFVDYLYEKAIYEYDKRFFSFALKLASVLKEQLNDISKLPKLMELIFIRNNKIAHSGQNFDRNNRKVNKNDIKDVFEVIYQLLDKVF